jgi:energy-coupling factor transport system permease protein
MPLPPAPQRHLHPGAWWLWALGLAAAASRTTNPLLLLLITAVAGYVVAVRKTDAPWARSYSVFLKLGLVVLVIRMVFFTLLGSSVPGIHILVTLPEIPLPHWAQGIRLGGPVSLEGLVAALYDAIRLAVLLACVGAANALANPARLLRSLPGALYEAGVAVVVALTFAPNLVADIQRLRAARRLRGRTERGARALLTIGVPILESALERSVSLAAAMDTRGFGRTALPSPTTTLAGDAPRPPRPVPRAVHRTTAALTLTGLLGICVAAYGLLGADGSAWALPVLILGILAATGGLLLGGRRAVRTRYRPDPWTLREWLVAGSGIVVAVVLVSLGPAYADALNPPVVPLAAPVLPLLPAAAILIGLTPALTAPRPKDLR